ncbi:MAG: zf-HC2 domain-containing protein [Acidobacteria bacterium]|nr:zf-HC2 domain-containing protein [Acidobacteriota bacterium]
MNCEQVKALRDPFLDGVLPAQQRALLEQHVQECQNCRTRLGLLCRFQAMLRDSRLPAPHALDTLVLRALYPRLQREPFWRARRTSLRCWWQSWNPQALLSKLVATPVTVFFFALMLLHFSSLPHSAWYPVYLLEPDIALSGSRTDRLQLSYVPMVQFAEASSLIPDDSFVVLTRVDKDGATTLERVLDAPHHQLLLQLFADRMEAVRYRPLQRNGSPVDAYIIVPYQKIRVIG